MYAYCANRVICAEDPDGFLPDWLKNAWESTKKVASDAWNWVGDKASDAWEWATDTATAAWEWTTDKVNAVCNWTVQTAVDVWDFFCMVVEENQKIEQFNMEGQYQLTVSAIEGATDFYNACKEGVVSWWEDNFSTREKAAHTLDMYCYVCQGVAVSCYAYPQAAALISAVGWICEGISKYLAE